MTTIATTLNGREMAGNGRGQKGRSSSLSSANGYLVINKPEQSEVGDGSGEKEVDGMNGCISPSSESSESTTATSQPFAKVCIQWMDALAIICSVGGSHRLALCKQLHEKIGCCR